MEIDDRTEAAVRNLFNAVVKSDENEFDAAVRALPDDESRQKALELAISICAFVLIDTYDRRPTAGDLELVSQAVVEMESWVSPGAQEVSNFLTSVINGRPLTESLDPQSAFFLTFIITGSLLAASPKIQDGEWWFNYLDRVEAAIESASSGK